MQGEELNNEPNANAVFKREGRTRATRSGNRIAKIGKVVKRKFVIIALQIVRPGASLYRNEDTSPLSARNAVNVRAGTIGQFTQRTQMIKQATNGCSN